MHLPDLGIVLYIAAWIFGGMIVAREARSQPNLVRLMAFLAIVLGPPGMLVYLGIRYIGQSIQLQALVPRQHDPGE
jgi:hypothetical protein